MFFNDFFVFPFTCNLCFVLFSLHLFFFIVSPRITPFFFEDNPHHAGQYVQVTCLVPDGDLPLSIVWTVNGKNLKEYPEINIAKVGKRSSILSVESVSYEHAGNITCIANNSAGESHFTTELLVNGYLFYLSLLLLF